MRKQEKQEPFSSPDKVNPERASPIDQGSRENFLRRRHRREIGEISRGKNRKDRSRDSVDGEGDGMRSSPPSYLYAITNPDRLKIPMMDYSTDAITNLLAHYSEERHEEPAPLKNPNTRVLIEHSRDPPCLFSERKSRRILIGRRRVA